MAEKNEKRNIFRKDNLDRMSSPEKLNDYIKVSNPSVWIILAAIGIMLAATVVWGITFELPDGLRPIEFLIGG